MIRYPEGVALKRGINGLRKTSYQLIYSMMKSLFDLINWSG